MKKMLLKLLGAGLNLVSFLSQKLAVRLAIQIFSTPRRVPLRQKERDFLATARQERRSIGDLPIVEYHWGEGPDAPLALLVYGWEYNAGRWRHFVPELFRAGFRVIAFDPPGHGLAPAGQMNIPRNALIIKDIIEKYGTPELIIGHSFGGSSSTFALSQMPEWRHPKRMVIMASFSYTPRIFEDFARKLGIRPSLYFATVRTFEQRVGKRLEEFDFGKMTAGFEHIKGLLVHAQNDDVTPVREAHHYFDFWQGAALLSPKTGGHHLGLPKITEAILEFSIEGKLPQGVEIQRFAMNARHDLVRHFAGV